MTRGGSSGASRGEEWSLGSSEDRDTQGFESIKTHDDTGLPNPPRKKIPKKIFRGPTFFSRKNFLRVWGVSVIMGFSLKPNPCHHGFWSGVPTVVSSWVLVGGPPGRVIMGFAPPPGEPHWKNQFSAYPPPLTPPAPHNLSPLPSPSLWLR